MPATELRRFDTRVWTPVTDAPNGSFKFFGLGATVSTTTTIPPGEETQVSVHDAGNLTGGGTVLVGLNGLPLTVVSVDSRTQIRVTNSNYIGTTGVTITADAGTRLILSSDPVTIYADAAGTALFSSTYQNRLNVSGGSPGAAWIPRPTYDFTLEPDAVAFDAVSDVQTLTGNGPTKNWSHIASGVNRLVLVGVTWQDELNEESIISVTYDGVLMSLLTSFSLGAVYYLVNPPTGSRTVEVTWSDTHPKGAVAASVSFKNVNTQTPFASAATANGSSTSPSVTVSTNSERGQIFNLVSVQAGASTTTLTANTTFNQRWNGSAGSSSNATLVQGGAVTLSSSGTSVNVGWTLASSRVWSMIAVAINAIPNRVELGVPGGVTVGAHMVDARNYASLQDAADDVAIGGTLMIPNGTYSVPSGGLIVRKPMTIQGETGTTLYSYSASTNQPVIKIVPGGAWLLRVTLRDLNLQNATLPTSPIAGNYGILCDVPTDGSKIGDLILERVFVKYMGDDGIRFTAYGDNDSYFVFVTLRNCQSSINRGRGMYLTVANLVEVYGSYFLGNDLDGFRAEVSQVEFHSTGFENNCLTSDTGRISGTLNGQLSLLACPLSVISACHVENFAGSNHAVCKRGIVIEGGGCATIMSNRIVGSASEDSSSSVRGIYITAGFESRVLACSIHPNSFFNVKTAIEIDGGDGLAKDCMVTAQRIEVGTGAMMLPTAMSDSGLFTMGQRQVGTSPPVRGLFLPPRENIATNALPNLSAGEAGFLLYDTTSGVLKLWNGSSWHTI